MVRFMLCYEVAIREGDTEVVDNELTSNQPAWNQTKYCVIALNNELKNELIDIPIIIYKLLCTYLISEY